jgi:hypothetical protein
MRDILIKRNELKNKSAHMRSMRFEPKVKDEQIMQIAKEQNEIYNKWNFYDKFIKAREGVKKNEIKSNNVGKEK